MAIAQHQFYLDTKTARSKDLCSLREPPPDLAGELSRSCLSLSTHSSSSNLSRSGSHSSLQHHSQTDSCSSESLHLARMELLAALQQRQTSLHDKLKEKTQELRILCLREGELTGELPTEYPLIAEESPPVVRKRVGTSFTLDETLISRIINKQDETVSSLELEYDIQAKITCASLRLANESSQKKGLRRQRRQWHHMASIRLRDIEKRLTVARNRQQNSSQNNMAKVKKKPRPVSEGEGCDDISLANSVGSLSNGSSMGVVESTKETPPFSEYGGGSSLRVPPSSLSAPPSPQRGVVHASQINNGKYVETNSAQRPSSGYIPSGYTRNQYRSQHYPTLSTRGCSVPPPATHPDVNGEVAAPLNHHPSFNGGLYNLPHQRTSLASHSLDDLDSSMTSHASVMSPASMMSTSLSASMTSTPNTNSHHVQPPHHKHFYHHQHQRKRNATTTATHEHPNINGSTDRYGSLDRRRATTGRLESRSMEHLDSLPHSNASSNTSTPQNQHHEASTTPHCNPKASRYDYRHAEPLEASPYPVSPHVLNESIGSNSYPLNLTVMGSDTTDGTHMSQARIDGSHGLVPHGRDGFHMSQVRLGTDNQNNNNSKDGTTLQRLVRTASGRSYMETTFAADENIPPASSLPPLRASHMSNRKTDGGGGHTTNLRPTASVNVADHLRPFRLPASELAPLRATKSSSVLPPQKPNAGGLSQNSNALNQYHQQQHRSPYNQGIPAHARSHQHSQSYAHLNGHSNTRSPQVTRSLRHYSTTVENGLLETSLSSPINLSSNVSKNYYNTPHNNSNINKSYSTNTPHNDSNVTKSYSTNTPHNDSNVTKSYSTNTPHNDSNINKSYSTNTPHNDSNVTKSYSSHIHNDSNNLSKASNNISINTSINSNVNDHSSQNILNKEPLLSLSEAAKIQKERWERIKENEILKHEKQPEVLENKDVIDGVRAYKDKIKDSPSVNTQLSNDGTHLEYKQPLAQHAVHNLSTSSIGSSGSSGSVFHSMTEGSDSLNSSLNATLTIESARNQIVISSGSFQPSREVSKPFEMSDFYKYSTKFRRQSSQGSTLNGSSSEGSGNELPSLNSPISSKLTPPPPSPSLIANNSSPAPQQKGVYTPLAPLTCKPMEGSIYSMNHDKVPNTNSLQEESETDGGSWEHTQIHQAIPVTVTNNKRSATLV